MIVAAEPGAGVEIFSLIEGRFDHGVAGGALSDGTANNGLFLGFDIPEFHVATLTSERRAAQNSVRAQFATAAPVPSPS